MSHDITAEDILRAIQFKQAKAGPGTAYNIDQREVVLARDVVLAREVYKDKKIKRYKDASREHEDASMSKDPLASVASPQEKASVGQEDFGSVITPVRTSSRYTGISVQHYITVKGVKLAINLQTPEGAEYGGIQQMTAELKRYDRLHEVRGRPDVDDAWFNHHLAETIADIKASGNRDICLGRPHAHRKRAAWFVNTFVVGEMSGNTIQSVILNIEGEEFAINLDQELTEHQSKYYRSTGLYGHIKKGRAGAPRIGDIPYTKFGE
jgi:hypothetical protein